VVLLAWWLPLGAQSDAPLQTSTPAPDTARDPAILRITVVEGEGAVYPLGGRATRGVTIQVDDDNYRPVEGASITFRLPGTGASGEFPTGGRSAFGTTGADGRANIWGIQWNRTPGPVDITVTAAKGAARATAVAHGSLASEADVSRTGSPAPVARGSHKLLWIVLGVAGAAAGGLAVAEIALKPAGTGSSAAVNAPQVGVPTIAIGHP